MKSPLSTSRRGHPGKAASARAVYERDAEEYVLRDLQPPERVLLQRLRTVWHQTDMLDVGVGAGRTSYTFGAVARTYIGVDYVPRMVELSRQVVGEDDHTKFVVGDARDLSPFYGQRFGCVLFSFNGIDYFSHDDRMVFFREARKVLLGDGWFAFSSHSLASLPLRRPEVRVSARSPLRTAYRLQRTLRTAFKCFQTNRRLDLDAARRRGWVITRDQAHDFSLDTYYVSPAAQMRQLQDAGFTVTDILDRDGTAVDPHHPGDDAWLYYLCRVTPLQDPALPALVTAEESG